MRIATIGTSVVADRLSPGLGGQRWEWSLGSDRLPDLPAGIDAVLVCHYPQPSAVAQGAPPWDEFVRQLLLQGTPVVVGPGVERRVMTLYEWEMASREEKTPLIPWLPQRLHPAISVVRERFCGARAELGPLEQLVCERCMTARDDASVLTQCIQDVDLLRALAGPLSRVTANSPAAEERLAQVNVQFAGEAPFLVQWRRASGSVEGLQLSFRGPRGQAVLSIPATHPAVWRLSVTKEGESQVEEFPAWDEGRVMAEVLRSALSDRQAAPAEPGTASTGARWSDAIVAAELGEAVERSLARGRTITLKLEEENEAAAFKGTMAALGCGMLLFTLLGLIVAAVATGFGFKQAGKYLYALPIILVGFLLLQLLRFLIPDAPRKPTAGND